MVTFTTNLTPEASNITFIDPATSSYNLFTVPADARINTVNCVGVMGAGKKAGVALIFKQRLPEMFARYQHDCRKGQIKPGKLDIWMPHTPDWTINFPTKRDWRNPSRYEDIEAGLVALAAYANELGALSSRRVKIAMPPLGCGNGGLDWKIVAPMISRHLTGTGADFIVFPPGKY